MPGGRKANRTLRLYAILRQDLEMPAGKAASQAGHAYLEAFLRAQIEDPQVCEAYRRDPDGSPSIGTKVCLLARDEGTLLDLAAELERAGLHPILIEDSGHLLPPHFDGTPILTALGVGPVRRDQLPRAMKKLAVA